MVYTLQKAQQSFKSLVQIHEKSGKLNVDPRLSFNDKLHVEIYA